VEAAVLLEVTFRGEPVGKPRGTTEGFWLRSTHGMSGLRSRLFYPHGYPGNALGNKNELWVRPSHRDLRLYPVAKLPFGFLRSPSPGFLTVLSLSNLGPFLSHPTDEDDLFLGE
jgi:hypothetical protein